MASISKDKEVNNLLQIFDGVKVNRDVLQAASLSKQTQFLDNEIKQAFQAISKQATKLEKDTDKKKKHEAAVYINDTLNALAKLSPLLSDKLKQQGLQNLQLKDFLNNAEFAKKLKSFLEAALKNNSLTMDIAKDMRLYYANPANQTQSKFDQLQERLQHDKAARNEAVELTKSAIEYGSNSGLYDPAKRIGALLSAWQQQKTIAPLEDNLYPNSKAPAEDINGKKTQQLRQSMTGRDF